MKTVLIVDDEFLVRLGLRSTLNWHTHGYEIVGEASSAEEALKVFKETKPDILMTDIKMKGMDGLQLIEKIKKTNPETEVIILTNYDDFHLARSAMQIGATQYILKSEISEKSLLIALHSLSVNKKTTVSNSQTKDELEQKYLHEKLLNICIDNNELEMITLYPLTKDIFTSDKYAILSVFCGTSLLSQSSIAMVNLTIKSWTEKLFGSAAIDFLDFKEHSRVIAIIPTNDYSEVILQERAQIFVKNILQYFDVVLHVGISSLGSRQSFDLMFSEAELARKSCFFTNQTIAVFSDIMASTGEKPEISQSNIKSIMKEYGVESVKDEIVKVFDQLRKIQNYQYVKNVFIDLLSLAKYMCESYDISNSPNLSKVKFDYSNFESMDIIDHVEHYLLEVYDGVSSVINQKSNSYSRVIKDCISFITENFHEQITLEDAASAVNLSQSYLSFIFKQETNINFNTFLTNYRIEHSKKLILSSNLKIYEIAEKVGFGSPYYFSKVFKDITKMTCKEFKNSNS